MWRTLLILAVAIGLSPGVFFRAPPAAPRFTQQLSVESLDLGNIPAPRLGASSAPRLVQGWRLTSTNESFGGFSSLEPMGEGRFIAFSDGGTTLEFAMDGEGAGPSLVAIGSLSKRSADFKTTQDVESLTSDPETGQLWLGYESGNKIVRYEAGLRRRVFIKPPEMANWPSNSGIESFARLADGRFMAIAEGAGMFDALQVQGLLFHDDPLESPAITHFQFKRPEGFRPTDLAQLPDGRVLVLLRGIKLGLPPSFKTRIVMANPATIREGQELAWEEVAQMEDWAYPLDNFEGMAVTPEVNGAVSIWLISDDNQMKFQRTLLLRLDWMPPSHR